MTYSLESAFVRAYAAVAVAVQAVLDAGAKLNELTRPPRRTGGFDEDAAGEFLAVSRTYRANEANAAIERQMVRDGLIKDRGTGAINDGEPQQVTLSGREFERYLEGALNEPYIAPDDEINRCYFCGDPTENLVNADDDPEFVCEDCCDDTPNPTEPSLDDNELIGVRGLLQERYGDQPERADTQDAQMWRAYVASAPVYPTPKQRADAAAIGDPYPPAQTGAGSNAPVASTTGPSGEAVSPNPPEGSASPRSRNVLAGHHSMGQSPTESGITVQCQCGVQFTAPNARDASAAYLRHSTDLHFDDAAAEWIGGAVPVITAVLADHHYWSNGLHCKCGAGIGDGIDPFDWRQHISPLIANALAPQPKPAFPETGLDMGARLDGCTFAADTFPQHTKRQK